MSGLPWFELDTNFEPCGSPEATELMADMVERLAGMVGFCGPCTDKLDAIDKMRQTSPIHTEDVPPPKQYKDE